MGICGKNLKLTSIIFINNIYTILKSYIIQGRYYESSYPSSRIWNKTPSGYQSATKGNVACL